MIAEKKRKKGDGMPQNVPTYPSQKFYLTSEYMLVQISSVDRSSPTFKLDIDYGKVQCDHQSELKGRSPRKSR